MSVWVSAATPALYRILCMSPGGSTVAYSVAALARPPVRVSKPSLRRFVSAVQMAQASNEMRYEGMLSCSTTVILTLSPS